MKPSRIIIGPRPTEMQCGHHLEFVDEDHKCRRPHGHSYQIRAWASCSAVLFDPEGCKRFGLEEPLNWVMDYGDLIAACTEEIYNVLDHTVLNDTIENPTTERLGLWAWPKIVARLPSHVELDCLEIAEGRHVCKLTR